ncbi:MAG TPA: ECF transporter S component [Anaerolineae bacterium]|nr:ECF transporter S component [Anaerolineae bacterium]
MNTQRLATTALAIAIVFVLVRVVQIPIPATGGYTHLGAVGEVFVAIAFGPIVGAVAAGVGAALADLTSGFGSFAPLTLIAHGALGLCVGWLAAKKTWVSMIIAWIIGGLALVAVYFLGEATVYGFGVAGAAAEVPINLFQVGLGVIGILLYQAVRRAFPQIEQMGQPRSFKEE